jgi:hypothetical protein
MGNAAGDANRAPSRHGITRIEDQIQKSRLHLVRIHLDERQVLRNIDFKHDGGTERAVEEIRHALDQLPDMQLLERHLLAPGEGQHALTQGHAAAGSFSPASRSSGV